jgi:hypothetical protein
VVTWRVFSGSAFTRDGSLRVAFQRLKARCWKKMPSSGAKVSPVSQVELVDCVHARGLPEAKWAPPCLRLASGFITATATFDPGRSMRVASHRATKAPAQKPFMPRAAAKMGTVRLAPTTKMLSASPSKPAASHQAAGG